MVLLSTQQQVAELAARVNISLEKVDEVLDKASHFLSISNVLGLVVIGGVCSLVLRVVDFVVVKCLLRVLELASLFTAMVLFGSFLWRLSTGMEPTGRDMITIVLGVVQLISLMTVAVGRGRIQLFII